MGKPTLVSSQAQLKKQVMYTNDGYTVSAIGIGTDYNERTLRMITDIGGGGVPATNPNDVATMEIEMSISTSIAARETAIEFSFPQGIRPCNFRLVS